MFKFLEEVIKDAAVSKTSNPLMSQVKIEVPEDRYKSDLELHDRFQDFSAELLKLELAGIAVFGIFLTLLGNKDTDQSIKNALHSCSFLWLSIFCLILLGVSVACALVHRFMASDGMYHHLRAIKLLILLEKRDVNPNFNFTNQEAQIKEDITADETNRNKKFKLSENFLKASAALLVAGTLFLGITFVRILI
jgi:hypothetical protein